MDDSVILSGIIIGAVGGSFAGITVWYVSLLREWYLKKKDKKTVYNWLYKAVQGDHKWRSAKTIASHTNLSIDRVSYIGSIHKDILLSTGNIDDVFGIKGISKY